MRFIAMLLWAVAAFAQQPVIYQRGAVNAASFAPFGLPNAPIARGSVFTIFGENIGPAQPATVAAFPLAPVFGGVSLSVTQGGATTQAYPIFVSSSQINAVMPSSVTTGLATLRIVNQGVKSNAVTIQLANSAPGIFTIGGGAGPGIIQNFVTQAAQPINSLVQPVTAGQVITIWATGLGPVTFPDNAAPVAGNVAAPVKVSIGGQPASILYSGRTPCCSGVDQLVVTVPANAPSGCWVPVLVSAGGVVSNTATIAIAVPNASSCDDPGNPLSKLARTPGSQAFLHFERIDSVENVDSTPAVHKTLDKLYSRFYTRPESPFAFDPYLSYPPAGTCTVHQTTGDSYFGKNLRGTLPGTASLKPQPRQSYSNGAQTLAFSPTGGYFSSTLGGNIDARRTGLNLLGQNAALTIDPSGANPTVLPISLPAAPVWTRPAGILGVPRNAPLVLAFTPGDADAPTAILLYSYSALSNSTVEVQCLAPPGANTFTIPADSLVNLPLSYGIVDGSYANLLIGTLGVNKATLFTNALAANGLFLSTSWIAQSVVLQ